MLLIKETSCCSGFVERRSSICRPFSFLEIYTSVIYSVYVRHTRKALTQATLIYSEQTDIMYG